MFILRLGEGVFKAADVRTTRYDVIIATNLEPIDNNCHEEYLDDNRIVGEVKGGKVIYTNEYFIENEDVKTVWEVCNND